MKVGLYSITYQGIWYRGPALSIAEFIAQAGKLGYDGVELDGKRPHANPMDLDERARSAIRSQIEREGMELIAIAANNDFSSPVPERRENEVLMVRELIRLAHDLGAPTVRLFAAWPGITMRDGVATYEMARAAWQRAFPGTTTEERWEHARAGLAEVSRIAEQTGVTLALQNHAPLIESYQDMLQMIDEVGSPALKACLDLPLLKRQDDAWVAQAARETGPRQVISHFGGEYERIAGTVVPYKFSGVFQLDYNYRAFVQAMHTIGYDGFISYELCHPVHIPGTRRRADIEYVHAQAALALDYMRGLIAAEKAER